MTTQGHKYKDPQLIRSDQDRTSTSRVFCHLAIGLEEVECSFLSGALTTSQAGGRRADMAQ
ncbi:hypothetical protein HETIRDRAFT_172543 [Heterobasidion irregulare TC 32-1]|uniref:Uncharacterized protein n=1 Tax=Heterobasidion irregulare (strain TC 32-1) TaxID=747525 RepID=W4JZJ7_HETIT|nr:uncharacterized protein HETIRDRAFT_172543 [Heterobasidion irregulare TC 32-1]ETW78972.1 hypothetical protein HETIRDRAFT_172543 [Heterobasidion irregulare TC 32-1]